MTSSRALPNRTRTLQIASEFTLMLFTLAVIASFARLFESNDFLAPAAATVVIAHLTMIITRRAGLGVFLSALLGLAIAIGSAPILFPSASVNDLGYSMEAFRQLPDDLSYAWNTFDDVTTPVEDSEPFWLPIGIAAWVIVYLADWAAFRLRSIGQALIPGVALFGFGAVFATDQYRASTAVAVAVSAMSFVLLSNVVNTTQTVPWLTRPGGRSGEPSLLLAGLGIGALTLIGGFAAAQSIPGYEKEPELDLNPGSDDTRVVLSPLVDIQARLVNQPDVELFTVQSETRDYWRITSLDVFDGQIWKSKGSYDEAAGTLESNLPEGVATDISRQTFDVSRLAEIWLPASYEPTNLIEAPEGVGIEYEADSGTLIVNRERDSSDGLEYTIDSAIPRRDPSAIALASDSVPDDIADDYLDLPDDFSPQVAEEAQRIVNDANATTPYEKALALQNYFRDPNRFSYDINAVNGHSSANIADFIFNVRVGYCEQFSGAYAAMARSIGLPARVAIGFTPGEFDPAINAYRVTGKHAHAWPEVWMDGIGWLRFEPTPGRGAPGDQAYTGQPEAQASALPGNTATTSPQAQAPLTTPTPAPTPDATPTTVPQTNDASPNSDGGSSGSTGGGGNDGSSGGSSFSLLWLLVISAPLALIASIAWGIARSERERSAAGTSPEATVALAWQRTKTAMGLLDIEAQASETPHEFAARAQQHDPIAGGTVEELAHQVTKASYSPAATVKADAQRAEQLALTVAAHAKAQRGISWWIHHADPRNIFIRKNGLWSNLWVPKPS